MPDPFRDFSGKKCEKGLRGESHQEVGGAARRSNEKIELVIARQKLAFVALAIVFAAALSHSVLAADSAHSTKADEQAGALLFRQQALPRPGGDWRKESTAAHQPAHKQGLAPGKDRAPDSKRRSEDAAFRRLAY